MSFRFYSTYSPCMVWLELVACFPSKWYQIHVAATAAVGSSQKSSSLPMRSSFLQFEGASFNGTPSYDCQSCSSIGQSSTRFIHFSVGNISLSSNAYVTLRVAYHVFEITVNFGYTKQRAILCKDGLFCCEGTGFLLLVLSEVFIRVKYSVDLGDFVVVSV